VLAGGPCPNSGLLVWGHIQYYVNGIVHRKSGGGVSCHQSFLSFRQGDLEISKTAAVSSCVRVDVGMNNNSGVFALLLPIIGQPKSRQ